MIINEFVIRCRGDDFMSRLCEIRFYNDLTSEKIVSLIYFPEFLPGKVKPDFSEFGLRIQMGAFIYSLFLDFLRIHIQKENTSLLLFPAIVKKYINSRDDLGAE